MRDRFWRFFNDWLAKDRAYWEWLLQALDGAPQFGRASNDDPDDRKEGAHDSRRATEAVASPNERPPVPRR